MNFASVIALFVVPESPKFLYSKRNYVECRRALAFINKFNRREYDVMSIKFDTEISKVDAPIVIGGKFSELLSDK